MISGAPAQIAAQRFTDIVQRFIQSRFNHIRADNELMRFRLSENCRQCITIQQRAIKNTRQRQQLCLRETVKINIVYIQFFGFFNR